MNVILKSGRYAGEVRDVRPDCARQMVADGRAVHANSEAAVNVTTKQTPVPKKKKGRR